MSSNKKDIKMTKTKEYKYVEVSEVLEKFGKYQIVQYIMICVPCLFVTMININYVFVAADLKYRCIVPECDNGSQTQFTPNWWPNSTIDKCSKPIIKDEFQSEGVCTSESFSDNVTECTEWIYETDDTVIAELNLACQPWKANMIGTIHNIGMLFSMILAGVMSDKLGRKPTMIFCAVASCIGQFKTLTSSYYYYVAIEFLEALFCGGIYPVTTILMIEISSKENRILSGILFAYIIYFGELIFSTITMFISHWKTIIRIIYTPPLLCIFYAYFIRESTRWQILKGRIDDAKDSIKLAAKMNKVPIDVENLKNMKEDAFKHQFNIDSGENKEEIGKIFGSKEIMKRLFVLSVCRFTVGFIYYGLMINSVWLPGDRNTNFLLATLASFPGEVVAYYFMNKVGRKYPLIFGYFASGILCVVSAYMPSIAGKLTLFLISKMVIAACFTGVITYMSELFPTSVRGSILGFGSFMTALGTLLAPLTPVLLPISPVLPLLLFCSTAIISGCLLTLTPETKHLPLLDTVNQLNTSNTNSSQHLTKNISSITFLDAF